jgi:hypothetical protein
MSRQSSVSLTVCHVCLYTDTGNAAAANYSTSFHNQFTPEQRKLMSRNVSAVTYRHAVPIDTCNSIVLLALQAAHILVQPIVRRGQVGEVDRMVLCDLWMAKIMECSVPPTFFASRIVERGGKAADVARAFLDRVADEERRLGRQLTRMEMCALMTPGFGKLLMTEMCGFKNSKDANEGFENPSMR